MLIMLACPARAARGQKDLAWVETYSIKDLGLGDVGRAGMVMFLVLFGFTLL